MINHSVQFEFQYFLGFLHVVKISVFPITLLVLVIYVVKTYIVLTTHVCRKTAETSVSYFHL